MSAPTPEPAHAPSVWANLTSPAALACFLLVAVLGVSLDLWTKSLAWNHFVEGTDAINGRVILLRKNLTPDGPAPLYDIVVAPKLLELTAVANQGAAMGLGQGLTSLFLVVSVGAIGVLFYFFLYSGRRRLYQIVLGLLLAGVLGNLYDRLVHGYVRDMIHIFPGVRWSSLMSILPDAEIFPWVFNLADVFLCVGVPAVLLYGIFTDTADATTPATEPAPSPDTV